MEKTYKASDLRIGMEIKIPGPWIKHPFLKNQFTITSDAQIRKLLRFGIRSVTVCNQKSYELPVQTMTSRNVKKRITERMTKITIPKDWKPEKLIPDGFKELINDKSLTPEKRANVVYKSSIEIMDKLLENPSTQNIKDFKKGTADIVDLILADDQTSNYLLNITKHDYYTYTHSVNVGVLSIMLAKEVFKKSNAHDMHELGAGFFLHDVGKVNVSTDIWNKPTRLTDEEMAAVMSHPEEGYKILSETNQLSEEARYIVMQHHERFNGTGYPYGLKGEEIHIYGRICSVADIYDALTSERPYKVAIQPFKALSIMKEEMLHHFQKEVFDQFVLLFK